MAAGDSLRKPIVTRAASHKIRQGENTIKIPSSTARRRHGVVLSEDDKRRMMKFVYHWQKETNIPNPHGFPVMWLYKEVELTPELEEFCWILSKSTPSERYLAKFHQGSSISSGSAYVNVFGSALRKAMSDQRVAGTILKDIWRKLPWEYLNVCENYYKKKRREDHPDSQPLPGSTSGDGSRPFSPDGDLEPRHRSGVSETQNSPSRSASNDDFKLQVLRGDNCTPQPSLGSTIRPQRPSVAWDQHRILPLLGINDPFETPLDMENLISERMRSYHELSYLYSQNALPVLDEISWPGNTFLEVPHEPAAQNSSDWDFSMDMDRIPVDDTAAFYSNHATQVTDYPTQPRLLSYNTTLPSFNEDTLFSYSDTFPNEFHERTG